MQVAGRYEVVRELARGASGCVYLATDLSGGRQVALKVLTPGKDAALLSRNEFARLLGLKHPHVVEILDIGEDAETGSPFLAMEYVEGISLTEALDGADEVRTLDYLIQAARALAYIHSRQLLHRDLKPANLLVRSDGVLKMVDFGLAADLRGVAQGAAGTLLYMAPEAIEGRPVDGRSDLYSLGLSFYHAFTGTPPFTAQKRADLIEQVLEGQFPPAGGPELPRILGPALRRLAARKPEDRFATPADLIRHVDLAVGGGLGLETAETERSYLTAPRMVGRARESARLAEALSAITSLEATPETPPLFLLGGEAGIGKSRFLMEFRKQAVLSGVTTIQVQCPEIASSPLQPFSLVLRALTPPASEATSSRGLAHKRLAAFLGGESSGGTDDAEAPERRIAREKSRVLDGFTGYLLDQASAAPLVIILEDLHWADGPSLDLVTYLSRNAVGSRLLLVASHRGENEVSEEFSSWLATVTRRDWCERLGLERLGEDDVLQMLGTVFDAAPIDAEVVRALARESGGNPLFLLEILRSLQSENALARTASGWRLPELEGVRAAIPQDLDRALARRLGRVEGTESIMLGALAVLARPAGPEIAAELAGVPTQEASAALDSLVGKGLLARTAWAGGRYVFEHALVRRAAEEHLDAPTARALHRKAGEILERDAPDVEGACEEIARHYTSGGPAERAALFSERAGDLALARHAGADAARHFEGALGLIPEADRERRGALLFKAGNGRLAAGDHSRARTHFEVLLEMTTEAGKSAEPGRRARVLERLGTVLGFQRSGEEGIAYVDEALVLFRQIGDLAGEARALHNLAIRHARQSRYAEALPQFHAALLVHERRGDVAAMADERNSLGLVECFLGRYEISAEHLESAFDQARSVDYRYLMGAARHNLGIVRRSQGSPEEALQCAREALAIFDEIGHRNAYGFAMLNVGLYSRAAGLLETALKTFRAARGAVARAADASREVYALECEADLLRYLGQPLTAVDRLGEAVRVATRAADERQRGYATAALSRALLDAGRPTEALEKAKAAFAIGEKTVCPRLVARSLVAISAASLGVGEPAEAAARARELLARSAAEIPLEEMAAEGNLLLASALMALADPGEAQDALGEAKRTIQARQLRSLAPLCARLEARLAQSAGAPEKARSLQKEAATLRRATAETIQDEALRRSFTTAVTFEWPKEEEEAAGSPSGGTAQAALQALYEITGLVSAAHALDELLDRVLDLVLEVVGAARGLIILIDDAGALEVRTSRGVERETARDATQYSKSIVRAAEAGEAILSTDAEHDERFNRFRSISLFRIKSLMCVPLRVRGRIIGTVYVDGGGKGRIFTKPDLSFLVAFANQAAVAIENARMYATLAQENQRLQRAAQAKYRFSNFIGTSAAMQKVFDLMERAAATPLPVLIQGESGTGKELVARALHFNSPRKARPFLSENCAAIPEALLESELFGYAQGAFTGANRDKKGLYEMADGGTLFLDEVGDMPFAIQAKFLRVLQEGEFRPVGGQEVRRASVRIVAATNADLAQRIADGRFREDLFYRLNVISILLPTLRSRKEDIPPLIDHFLARAAKERKFTRMSIADDLLSVLVRYNWPGNVRQLENALSRLSVMSSGPRITLKDLEADPQLYDQLVVLEPGPTGIEDLTTIEKRQILRALQETGGNRVQAAQMLGISRATIFRKIREFGIS